MKFGLKEETINQINGVFAKYPQIQKAILYGSRAKGNFKNGSDIDLVLEGNKLEHQFINKIALDLDDLLLPYSFDLANLKEVSSPDLLDHISRIGIVFYEALSPLNPPSPLLEGYPRPLAGYQEGLNNFLDENNIQAQIQTLAKAKNAVILAHIYQRPEIQDIADYVGDSLGLSQEAERTEAKIIVFCGVDFMAETAKILSPDKKVLVPDLEATCPMAHMITPERLREKKKLYPEAAVVCYVNTNADIKAESDICCTSRNAVEIVKSLIEKLIIFVPDKSLGAYVASQVPEKEFIFWEGFCPTHHRIIGEYISALQRVYPQAKVAAHPECMGDVLALADYIGSTGGIQKYVKESTNQEFIIASEEGIIYRLQQDNPEKIFYHPTELGTCPNMKKNTLEKLYFVLNTESNEIFVDKEIADKAREAITRMLAV